MSSRTPERLFAAMAILLAVGLTPAVAFDGPVTDDHRPLAMFKNPKAALRAGLDGVRAGHARTALAALQYAAESGEQVAQWKLGKMYADGDGVPHDDAKAFDYFSQLVDSYDEDNADPRQLPFVASAFVALGTYNLSGVANSRILANPTRALEMFHYAAVNFGDATAQYNLGRMYLEGNGVAKDTRQAARWLYLAADKGHVEAQVLLGQLLFNGYPGASPQRSKGLMWLSLAHASVTDASKAPWVTDVYKRAMASASDGEREVAAAYLDEHAKHRN